MFDEIIVAVDLDEAAFDALALGKALASPGATLTLVHVEADGSTRPGETHVPPPLVSLGGGRGETDYPFVVAGAASPVEGLHDFARRTAADLLVIGSSRRRDIDRALGRGATRAILDAAPCAVAGAPAGYASRAAGLETIGVGYDGSLASKYALATARRLAAEGRAKPSALRAVRPRVAHAALNFWQEIDDRVAGARRRLSELGDVEPHAEYGSRAEQLARYGASVDLLLIGPHEHDGARPASLALRLAHRAPCPVLVVPKPLPVVSAAP